MICTTTLLLQWQIINGRGNEMGKKYLIYVDILGYKAKAAELAEISGFEEDVIRETFLSHPLNKKIEKIKEKGIEVSKGISEIEGSDNYVLIHNVGVFKSINEIFNFSVLFWNHLQNSHFIILINEIIRSTQSPYIRIPPFHS
jgi:hypothetical protein